ncbi:MAG TPA: DUF523 domain-containing protein [Rhizomicrobium sp.]|nr:DUF523 domain-containing protein [Rhizomicrobium sp.]
MTRPKPIPARPSLEWLRKTAKDRLAAMRAAAPAARLHSAQRAVAQAFGFASWRAMKTHVDRLIARRIFAADGAPVHLPRAAQIAAWPAFTPESPLKILMSGCLAGQPVLVDGQSFGANPVMRKLRGLPNVQVVPFCPENFAFGTPRATPDIHGGDGHDVLDGRARVLSDTGEDWTEGMVRAAHHMLALAKSQDVGLAVLTDISAACGSQVIYRGARAAAAHQIGQGVCAALLTRNGIPIVSQRDYRTLNAIFRKLDPKIRARPDLIDHHEIEWYRDYFQA